MRDLTQTLGAYHGTVWINERFGLPATLRIEQDRIGTSTRGPKADPAWSTEDSNGHFHAWSVGAAGQGARDPRERYPTLRPESVHVECDGSCGGVCEGDGYDITRYRCVLCGEEVEPGLIPGPHFDTIPGLSSWEIKAEGYISDGSSMGSDQVSMRFLAETPRRVMFFGIARPGDVKATNSGRPFLSVTLFGSGLLGERPAPAEVKAA